MAEPKTKANSGYISDALRGGSEKAEERKRKSIGRGQTIASDYSLDNVDLTMSLPDEMGGKVGGSTTNLSHSLKGASAVDD